MKNLSSIMRCAGTLLAAVLISLFASCGGGGKLTVTPKVDVDVTPPSNFTMTERLSRLGLGSKFEFFEAYEDKSFLRVTTKPPAAVLKEGQKTDFGIDQVWCKPYMVSEKKFVEKNVTAFKEVTFSGTAGSPTPGGDRLLWQLYWHQISGLTDISGTVQVLPDVFITSVWDQLNGGILNSIKADYNVVITITDGEVKISGDNSSWIGWAAAAFVGFCPQVTFTWLVDRDVVPTPTNRPPTVTDYYPQTSNINLYLGDEPFGFRLVGIDPDGDPLRTFWILEGGAPVEGDNFYFDPTELGDFTLVGHLIDGQGGDVTRTWTITVLPVDDQNKPPVAVATATPMSGTAPLSVNFDASGSSDPDGNIIEYAWDLDSDGTPETEGVTTSYVYGIGTYVVTLWVTDDDMVSFSDTVTITVNPPTTNENFVLFVAGIDGELSAGQTIHIQQGMGRKVADHFELRGDQGTTIPIPISQVQTNVFDLPDWVWTGTGELVTMLWANPDNPNLGDPGNIFITVTDPPDNQPYPIFFSVVHNGVDYGLGITLTVDANPNL